MFRENTFSTLSEKDARGSGLLSNLIQPASTKSGAIQSLLLNLPETFSNRAKLDSEVGADTGGSYGGVEENKCAI